MLLHLANAGECALIGVASWSTEAYAVPAIEVVLRTYGRPRTPIGARQDSLWHERWQHSKPIVDHAGSHMTHPEAEPAPALYRRLVARSYRMTLHGQLDHIAAHGATATDRDQWTGPISRMTDVFEHAAGPALGHDRAMVQQARTAAGIVAV